MQCKYYTYPVGNKAVQEAYSGAKFYDCDRSAVLTNSTFTKSARELAGKIGVDLWEHNQIPGTAARFLLIRYAGIISLILGLAGFAFLYMTGEKEISTVQKIQCAALASGGCFGVLECGKFYLAALSAGAYALSFCMYYFMETHLFEEMFLVQGISSETLFYTGILVMSFLRAAYLWIRNVRIPLCRRSKKRKK